MVEGRGRELEVFINAKKYCEHIFQITSTTPKGHPCNISDKILTHSLDLVETLYANHWPEAESKIKVLNWLTGFANEMEVFNDRQTEKSGKLLGETRQSLWKWIKHNDKKPG